MFNVTRDQQNPLISPNLSLPWQAEAAFNPSPVIHQGKLHVLFRAAIHPALYREHSDVELSTIGVASSRDDDSFEIARQLVVPSQPWDMFGCEDPRVTKLGDTYYIFYTALGDSRFRPITLRWPWPLPKTLKPSPKSIW